MRGPVCALACVLVLGGCKSAQEKCDEARTAATGAWSAYTGALEAEAAKAKATILDNKRALAALDGRIGELAKAASDKLYTAGSDAWLRGYHVAFIDQCMKDPECSGLKHGIAEAEASIKDIDERLGLARAAASAVADAKQAKAAADACILDAARPALKAAQAKTVELVERCADLPPPEEPKP